MTADSRTALQADVGIVGAGPGGMAAAVELARQGLSVTILDEGMRAGGQIFRQLPEGCASPDYPEPPSHEQGHVLLHDLGASAVRVVNSAVVWDAEPGRLWFEHEGRSAELTCRAIVLAPGAYDRFVPFPGWTLPGVISAGAAQVMVRGFGVQPGQRALVAGTGPLLLPTVTALLSVGVEVVGALEAAPRSAMLRLSRPPPHLDWRCRLQIQVSRACDAARRSATCKIRPGFSAAPAPRRAIAGSAIGQPCRTAVGHQCSRRRRAGP